jgi:hypothetical protein
MSDATPNASEAPRHETRDANLRNIFWVGVALYAVLVFALIAVGFLLAQLYVLRPPLAGPLRPIEAGISGAPPLEVNPRQDLAVLHEREERILTHYGWIDPQAGIVRLPIDRAMNLLVERQRRQGGGP